MSRKKKCHKLGVTNAHKSCGILAFSSESIGRSFVFVGSNILKVRAVTDARPIQWCQQNSYFVLNVVRQHILGGKSGRSLHCSSPVVADYIPNYRGDDVTWRKRCEGETRGGTAYSSMQRKLGCPGG